MVKRTRTELILLIGGILVSFLYCCVFPFFLVAVTGFFAPTKSSYQIVAFGIGFLLFPVVLLFGLFLVLKFTKANAMENNKRHNHTWVFVSPLILQIGVILLLPRFDHRTPLMKAAANGDLQKVNEISLTPKFSIYESTVYQGFSTNAMMEAIKNNQSAVVQFLLDKDIDIVTKMDSNLDYAVRMGSYAAVNTLISNNAIKLTKDSGASAVSSACYYGKPDIAELLIKSGADDTFVQQHGCITLDEMLAKTKSECDCNQGKTDQAGNCAENADK